MSEVIAGDAFLPSAHFAPSHLPDRDVIRRLLSSRLGGDPGTLNFCYPYARFMSPGGSERVTRSWTALATKGHVTDIALYVHIPFCPGHCMFCGFATTYGLGPDKIDGYLSTLEREIELYRRVIPLERFRVAAFFIGGGTPNYLDVMQFRRLFEVVRRSFVFATDAEVTVELYPQPAIIDALLPRLAELGVNRVSVCAQDFNDEVLSAARRFYRGADALRCAAESRSNAIDEMNVDLMVGIPGQEFTNASTNLDALHATQPSHVTLNPFSRRSPAIPWARRSFDASMTPTGEVRKLYEFYADWLLANGYQRVTKTNFERRGSRGFVYEQLVRSCVPRFGLGVNALSFTGDLTYRNAPTLETHARAVAENGLPVEATYLLDEDDLLRCRLYFAALAPHVQVDLASRPEIGKIVEVLSEFELAYQTHDGFALTADGVWNAGIVQRCFFPPSLLRSMVTEKEAPCSNVESS